MRTFLCLYFVSEGRPSLCVFPLWESSLVCVFLCVCELLKLSIKMALFFTPLACFWPSITAAAWLVMCGIAIASCRCFHCANSHRRSYSNRIVVPPFRNTGTSAPLTEPARYLRSWMRDAFHRRCYRLSYLCYSNGETFATEIRQSCCQLSSVKITNSNIVRILNSSY